MLRKITIVIKFQYKVINKKYNIYIILQLYLYKLL